jgi:hypothetical protein
VKDYNGVHKDEEPYIYKLVRHGTNWIYYDSMSKSSTTISAEDITHDHESKISFNIDSSTNTDTHTLSAIYKVVKKGVNVYQFDVDGVLHRSVGAPHANGSRHPYKHGVQSSYDKFAASLKFIKDHVNDDDKIISIASHNPNCHAITRKIFEDSPDIFTDPVAKPGDPPIHSESYKLFTRNIANTVPKIYNAIMRSANVFIEDSPKYVNQFIIANDYGILRYPFTLYLAIPELNKYIKINQNNKILARLQPLPPGPIISPPSVENTYSILQWNMCWECMSEDPPGFGTGIQYSRYCRKVRDSHGLTYNPCKENLKSATKGQDGKKFDIICLQEAGPTTANDVNSVNSNIYD